MISAQAYLVESNKPYACHSKTNQASEKGPVPKNGLFMQDYRYSRDSLPILTLGSQSYQQILYFKKY